MITLYTYTTPNGRKISIMLEELGIPYRVKVINLSKNEQFHHAFSRVSPNNKIPVLVDSAAEEQPLAIFESGAILIYLAEKYNYLLAPAGAERSKIFEWLHWQVGGLCPALSQLANFGVFAREKSFVAIKHYVNESNRLLDVMEKQLDTHAFLAGDDYSIADIAAYPWVINAGTFLSEFLGESVACKPAIQRWLRTLGQRPAVRRGMAVPII